MAAAGDNDFQKICKLRELFGGRFTEEEATLLIHMRNGSLQEAAGFVMASEPQEVAGAIAQEQSQWEQVKGKIRRLKRTDPRIFLLARTGVVDTSARQFGCQPCDNMWWKRCPDRKQVSKCRLCRVCYEAVPRDREWGWATYLCTCGNEFSGHGQMGTTSPCYKCGNRHVYPARINPPGGDRRPRTRTRHACNAADCQGGHGGLAGSHCAHPATRRSKVLHPSAPHECSGSTVATFLSQDDLNKRFEHLIPMPSVIEGDEPSDGSDGSAPPAPPGDS